MIGRHDPEGSFAGLGIRLKDEVAALSGYEVHSIRVGDVGELRRAIREFSQIKAIDTLVLAFHGYSNAFLFASNDPLNQRNVRRELGDHGRFLARDARVLLYSCLTGHEDDNMAEDLALAFRREVQAPRYFWCMQTLVPPESRIPELRLDRSGRLEIAEDRFGLYYKPRDEKGIRYLIGTKAMAPFCLEEGYVQRRTPSGGLFLRYRP
ncbi:MAG: hypothetical protein AAF514_20975 [Verrucomicrobiota bacterium]